MKNRLFSKALIKEAMIHLRLPGLIVTCILFLISLVEGLDFVSTNTPYGTEGTYTYIFSKVCPEVKYIIIYSAIFMILTAFNYLNKRNASDLFDAIPVRKSCLYSSFLAATWLWAVIMIAASSVPVLSLSLFNSECVISITSWLSEMAIVFAGYFLIVAVGALAMSLTGTLFTNVVIMGMILFVPRMLINIYAEIIESSMPFIRGGLPDILSGDGFNIPYAFISSIFSFDVTDYNVWDVIYSIGLGAIYCIIGYYVLTRRKSEMAGKGSISRRMQAIIRIVIFMIICTVPIDYIYCGLIEDELGQYTLELILSYGFAVIAYFGYEMITTKRVKDSFKKWKGLLVGVALNVVIIGTLMCVYNVECNFRPEADDIKYVRVLSVDWNNMPEGMSKYKFSDDEIKKLVSDQINRTMEGFENNNNNYSYRYEIEIVCKNGTKKVRRLWSDEEFKNAMIVNVCKEGGYADEMYDIFLNSKNTIGVTLDGNNISLSRDQYPGLYLTYNDEIKTVSPDILYQMIMGGTNSYENYSYVTYLRLDGRAGINSYVAVNGNLSATLQAVKYAINKKYPDDGLDMLNKMVNGDPDYEGLNIQVTLEGYNIFDQDRWEYNTSHFYSFVWGDDLSKNSSIKAMLDNDTLTVLKNADEAYARAVENGETPYGYAILVNSNLMNKYGAYNGDFKTSYSLYIVDEQTYNDIMR